MKNLLLLSAGTNACYHVAKILKEKFINEFRIIGADINDSYLIPTTPYLDAFYKVPYTNSPDYYQTILNICREEHIDYLLPSFDADQKLFYFENPDLLELKICSFAVKKQTQNIYEDKLKMYTFLQGYNFPLPQMYNINSIIDNDVYFIKPLNGIASIGAKKASGKEIKNLSNSHEWLIQEVCSGPEYTLECFYFDGILRTIARERIATKAGVCVKTKICQINELTDIAKKFVQVIDVPYCFNLQFMKNTKNEYVLTDVNLRLAGGMSLSYVANWDEVSALGKIMLNERTQDILETLPEKIPEQYVVRAYKDIVTKVERPVVAFDWDGTLLDSRERHKAVMDYVLSEFNIKIDTSDLVEFKSNGKNNIDYLISKGITESVANKVQQEWIQHIEKEEFLKIDKLYPETHNILQKYAKNNDLILITARSNADAAKKQIKEEGVAEYFKEIFIVSPEKDVSIKKAEILKQQKAILMIGDTISDAKAAKIAEIDFEFHENGFHKHI